MKQGGSGGRGGEGERWMAVVVEGHRCASLDCFVLAARFGLSRGVPRHHLCIRVQSISSNENDYFYTNTIQSSSILASECLRARQSGANRKAERSGGFGLVG